MRSILKRMGGFGVDMSTLPRASVGSLSHRLLRNWTALLSVRQARKRLSIAENHSLRGLDLWRGIPRVFCAVRWTRRVFVFNLWLFGFSLNYYLRITSFRHKFCDRILVAFRFVRTRGLKWMTWMWLCDRLLPLRYNHSRWLQLGKKDSKIII